MKRLFTIALSFCTLFFAHITFGADENTSTTSSVLGSTRIVSLAPSITEILFAIGAGQQTVGITRYCTFPPETVAIPQIGGYFDPNYEAIYALQPTLAIQLTEHVQASQNLKALGLSTLTVDHQSFDGILQSIILIGDATGHSNNARMLYELIQRNLENIKLAVQHRPPKRVLLAFARPAGSGAIDKLYVAGNEKFYTPLLQQSGGINAYQGSVAFPVISTEGLLQINPEIIIDITTDPNSTPEKELIAKQQWQATFPHDTFNGKNIHVLPDNVMVIPGPRIDQIAYAFAKAIHPQANIPIPQAHPDFTLEHPDAAPR